MAARGEERLDCAHVELRSPPKPRRSQRFAGQKHLIQELPIHLLGKLDHVNNGMEHRCLVRPSDAVMHSASPQCFHSTTEAVLHHHSLGENLG